MSYVLNILKDTCRFARNSLARQLRPAGLCINFNGFLLGPNFSGTCKCEKRLEVTRGSQSSRPPVPRTQSRGGRARREGNKKKNSRSRLPIKKPPRSGGCTGLPYNVGGNPCTAKSIFSPGLCPPPVALLCLCLRSSRLQVACVFHCTRYFRCNRI